MIPFSKVTHNLMANNKSHIGRYVVKTNGHSSWNCRKYCKREEQLY